MGAYQRRKGHGFERECARLLRRIFPQAKRHLEVQMQEALGFDLDCTEPFKVQCKRGRKYSNPSAIEEIRAQGIKVLVTKADHKPAIACVYLDDFLSLCEAYLKCVPTQKTMPKAFTQGYRV